MGQWFHILNVIRLLILYILPVVLIYTGRYLKTSDWVEKIYGWINWSTELAVLRTEVALGTSIAWCYAGLVDYRWVLTGKFTCTAELVETRRDGALVREMLRRSVYMAGLHYKSRLHRQVEMSRWSMWKTISTACRYWVDHERSTYKKSYCCDWESLFITRDRGVKWLIRKLVTERIYSYMRVDSFDSNRIRYDTRERLRGDMR